MVTHVSTRQWLLEEEKLAPIDMDSPSEQQGTKATQHYQPNIWECQEHKISTRKEKESWTPIGFHII